MQREWDVCWWVGRVGLGWSGMFWIRIRIGIGIEELDRLVSVGFLDRWGEEGE
jgi:hypothetical protein